MVCLSKILNSIKVPPLKSTPKFRPLNISKIIEIIIKLIEKILNTLKYLLKLNL